MPRLNFREHSRRFADFIYVYPVVSRRSQGLSLGINLNINNACNWRCVYCQVEDLVRGTPTAIDLIKLEQELDAMLEWIVSGDFIVKYVSAGLQRFNDISLSGNGEPTLSTEFKSVVEIIAKLRTKYNLTENVKTILITNGSKIDQPNILTALAIMHQNNGEIWFKLDNVTSIGMQQINQVKLSLKGVEKRLKLAASRCKTYIQTCLFQVDHLDPSATLIDEYIKFIAKVKEDIAGVLLYSTARNPALLEGQNISEVSREFLASVAARIEKLQVKVNYYV